MRRGAKGPQRLIAAAKKKKNKGRIMLKKERKNNKGLSKSSPNLSSTLSAFALVPKQ
jgi:hypothetical protein